MTTSVRILENDGRVQISASGGQTSLPFDFPIYDESHIRIIRTRAGVDTTLAITTDYTVPVGSVGVEAGGTITLNSGATAGDIYTLLLDVPYSRTTDFIPAGDFFAETLNLQLDLLTQQNQQIVRDLSLAMRLPDSTTIPDATLPVPEASKLIGWDASANGLSNYALADLSTSVVSSFAQTLLDDTDAATARATLGVTDVPFTAASSSTAAYLDFAEDTDNGANKARVIAPATLAADATITLPGVTGTLATLAGTEALTGKTMSGASNTFSAIPSSAITFARSEVYVDTGNGHGSTATKIRRFTNTRKNTGTAITYADSATNGGTFTINEDGIYSIYYSDYKVAGNIYIAITVDVSSTTTNANGLTYANGKRLGVNTGGANIAGETSWTGFLASGAVVRAQNDGTADSADAFCAFSIVKITG